MPTTEVTDPMLLDSTGQDIVTKLQAIVTALGSSNPGPSSTTPLTDGQASQGTENAWARGDHRHGTDTSRAAASLEINGHALTGDFDLDADDIEYDSVDSVKDRLDAIDGMLPDTILGPPAADGTYILQCVVSNGNFSYEWVSAS